MPGIDCTKYGCECDQCPDMYESLDALPYESVLEEAE